MAMWKRDYLYRKRAMQKMLYGLKTMWKGVVLRQN